MKTASIPTVRVEPALRQEMERSLQAGETLASLVETAVRKEIAARKAQAGFVSRGLVAIEKTVREGSGIPADAVLARLEKRLDAARRGHGA